MSGVKTLSSFGVGLGVLAVGLSGQSLGLLGTVFPLGCSLGVSSSVHLPYVVVVAVVDAVCGAW